MMVRFVKLSDLEREWLARAYGERLVSVRGDENVRVWRHMRKRGLVGIDGEVQRIGPDLFLRGYIAPKGALQLRSLSRTERENYEREHERWTFSETS